MANEGKIIQWGQLFTNSWDELVVSYFEWALGETQKASSRNLTQITDSIFYDDNRYAKCVSTIHDNVYSLNTDTSINIPLRNCIRGTVIEIENVLTMKWHTNKPFEDFRTMISSSLCVNSAFINTCYNKNTRVSQMFAKYFANVLHKWTMREEFPFKNKSFKLTYSNIRGWVKRFGIFRKCEE